MGSSGSNLTPVAVSAADVVRQYQRSTVLPDLLERKLSLSRNEAVSVLKELADAGFGDFVLGRRGGSTRLEKAAQLPDSPTPLTDVAPATSAGEVAGEPQQVLLLTRPNPVKVSVPANITFAEAERVSKWLKAIAIDSKE